MFAERKETQPRAQCRTQLASAKTAMPPDLLHFAAHHRKTAVRSPTPSPKTPQAAGPCSWACRRLRPPSPQPNRNAAHPPPARGVGVRRIRANGAGRRHCRPPCSWGRRAVLRASSRCKGKGRAVPCDAALPRWGKGRCRCAGSTLFAPAGQKRFRVARRIWAGSWERAFCRALCPSGGLSRRAGERKAGSHLCRPRFQTAAGGKSLLVGLPPSACTAAPSGTNRRLSAPCSWGRQASTSSQRHWLPALPARRALPAPAQGINPLRIPFWGRPPFSRGPPSPKTPQAAGSCS